MRRAGRALLVGAFLTQPASAAPLEALDADGWYTWRVEAAEDAPGWCCLARSRDTPVQRACNLDGRQLSYVCGDDAGPVNGFVQIYAKVESGETAKLRVLSPTCPVDSGTEVSDLGEIEADESFRWLSRRVQKDSRIGKDALAAIAMHRGEPALRYLTDAANGGADGELREDAIFWLGQVRISEASSTIQRLMFSDDRPEIRQHAAFALAQSKSPDRAEALVRQGREDPDGDTRAKAWFWLAQTGASESEEAILQAIADDPDREVREDTVFALSQLPDERAVDALIAVLEDRRSNREVREKALFWLVQSESDRALSVVERLLVGGDAGRY